MTDSSQLRLRHPFICRGGPIIFLFAHGLHQIQSPLTARATFALFAWFAAGLHVPIVKTGVVSSMSSIPVACAVSAPTLPFSYQCSVTNSVTIGKINYLQYICFLSIALSIDRQLSGRPPIQFFHYLLLVPFFSHVFLALETLHGNPAQPNMLYLYRLRWHRSCL